MADASNRSLPNRARGKVFGFALLAIAIAAAHLHAEEKAPHPVAVWGGRGAAEGQFDFPIGIAIDRDDEVLVTDFTNGRVQRFTSDGKFLSAFAVAPFPGGIALDGERNIHIAHMGIPPSKYEKPRERDKVAVYSPTGELVREWGKFGTADGEFDMPGGIAISRDGRVYVGDQCNRRVQVFDRQGKFLMKWGHKGSKPGEFGGDPHPKAFFAGPTFLAIDRQGNVYTTEAPLRGVGRVQKFTSDGKFLLTWGDSEDTPGKFGGNFGVMEGPTGLCLDAVGRLWVNSIGGRIQQFSDQGEYIAGFGSAGASPGEFLAPHGLAIDSRGRLYIVDAFNHRVQKFAVD